MDALEKTTTQSSPHFKPESMRDVVDFQLHPAAPPKRTGMTPSCHNNDLSWVPLNHPVVPENAVPAFNDRQLDPLEWVKLLEQSECLNYVSPDIDECIERHSRMEGNQELELSGREFVDSPAILRLLASNTSSSTELSTFRKPFAQLQRSYVSRRPGLREHFSRQELREENNEAIYRERFPAIAKQLVQMKKPLRSSSSMAKQSADQLSSRSASRLLKFEAPQHSDTRPKRASWGGRSARAATTSAALRRECKSARKSKDCMIPGCTKGARSRGLCKRHGGGKRCTHAECSRSDQGGGFCIAHGGGKRCAAGGCKNSAQSRGLCKSHGGGKRCRAKGCAKSSQAGGFCRGHKPDSTFI